MTYLETLAADVNRGTATNKELFGAVEEEAMGIREDLNEWLDGAAILPAIIAMSEQIIAMTSQMPQALALSVRMDVIAAVSEAR